MMKIYDWFDGPYPARVRIAIAEKNLQSRVRFESINLVEGRAQAVAISRHQLLGHASGAGT